MNLGIIIDFCATRALSVKPLLMPQIYVYVNVY